MDENLQKQAKGQVVWHDEAGMVGTKDKGRLFEIAEKQHIRVILTGDTKQHSAVGRGDAMRLLVEKSGVPVVEVGEIQRQKRLSYKRAVRWLSEGEVKAGFDELDRMGAIKEIDGERYKLLAKGYVSAVKSGMSAPIVSPTHAEKQKVTEETRKALKEAGVIRGMERPFVIQKNKHLTLAEKKQVGNYQKGQLLQMTKHAKGFEKGEKLKVLGPIRDSHLWVMKQNGNIAVSGVTR